MRFDVYLKTHRPGMSDAEYGRLVGISGMSVGRYKRGERIPEPRIVARICEESRGLVTPNDFYGLSSPPEDAESDDDSGTQKEARA